MGNELVGNISYSEDKIYQMSTQETPGLLLCRARESHWKTVKKIMLEILIPHDNFERRKCC